MAPAPSRPRRDAALSAQIDAVHARLRRACGERRFHAESRERHVRLGRRRIARLMRAMGLGPHGAVFEYIEGWYNPDCRHSALD